MKQTIEFLRKLAAELNSQDNQSTAHPIYFIDKQVLKVNESDIDFATNVGWFYEESILADDEESRELDDYYQRYSKSPDGWARLGYDKIWQSTGRFYLTRNAADAFVDGKPDLRVYVDSAYDNSEIKEIQRLLSGPLLQCIQALQQANEFITNGIEGGFIRMPDGEDPAHATPDAVKNALLSLGAVRESHAPHYGHTEKIARHKG